MGTPQLRDYTSVPFEIFIAVFTILPFFLLAYFYPVLSDRVPLFMHLNGEVAEWAGKNVMTVFRVPLLALVTQVFCLLMKYGTIQSGAASPFVVETEQAKLYEQSLNVNAALWDWFRWTVAFKMMGESVNTITLSLDLKWVSRMIFIFTAIAALVGVAGALFYGYQLLVLKRRMKQRFGELQLDRRTDATHVYGGFLYFNSSDSALFVDKYFFNFGNKWAWVFIACIIAYPLLVFGPG